MAVSYSQSRTISSAFSTKKFQRLLQFFWKLCVLRDVPRCLSNHIFRTRRSPLTKLAKSIVFKIFFKLELNKFETNSVETIARWMNGTNTETFFAKSNKFRTLKRSTSKFKKSILVMHDWLLPLLPVNFNISLINREFKLRKTRVWLQWKVLNCKEMFSKKTNKFD